MEGEDITGEAVVDFYKFLNSKVEYQSPSWSDPNIPRVSADDNTEVFEAFLEGEALEVVRWCVGDKAPGFTIGY